MKETKDLSRAESAAKESTQFRTQIKSVNQTILKRNIVLV